MQRPDLGRMHLKRTSGRISLASGWPRFWHDPCWPEGSCPAMRAEGDESLWTAAADSSGSDATCHETDP